MGKMKTKDQINAEVAALVAIKPKVPKRTAFGDDNLAAIDAQLAALRERMSSDEVCDAYGDEESDEFDQYTLDAAITAYGWMTGMLAANEESPAASWAGAEA